MSKESSLLELRSLKFSIEKIVAVAYECMTLVQNRDHGHKSIYMFLDRKVKPEVSAIFAFFVLFRQHKAGGIKRNDNYQQHFFLLHNSRRNKGEPIMLKKMS